MTSHDAAQKMSQAAEILEQISSKSTKEVPAEYVRGAVRHVARNMSPSDIMDPEEATEKHGESWSSWDRYEDPDFMAIWTPMMAETLSAMLRYTSEYIEFYPIEYGTRTHTQLEALSDLIIARHVG